MSSALPVEEVENLLPNGHAHGFVYQWYTQWRRKCQVHCRSRKWKICCPMATLITLCTNGTHNGGGNVKCAVGLGSGKCIAQWPRQGLCVPMVHTMAAEMSSALPVWGVEDVLPNGHAKGFVYQWYTQWRRKCQVHCRSWKWKICCPMATPRALCTNGTHNGGGNVKCTAGPGSGKCIAQWPRQGLCVPMVHTMAAEMSSALPVLEVGNVLPNGHAKGFVYQWYTQWRRKCQVRCRFGKWEMCCPMATPRALCTNGTHNGGGNVKCAAGLGSGNVLAQWPTPRALCTNGTHNGGGNVKCAAGPGSGKSVAQWPRPWLCVPMVHTMAAEMSSALPVWGVEDVWPNGHAHGFVYQWYTQWRRKCQVRCRSWKWKMYCPMATPMALCTNGTHNGGGNVKCAAGLGSGKCIAQWPRQGLCVPMVHTMAAEMSSALPVLEVENLLPNGHAKGFVYQWYTQWRRKCQVRCWS